MFSQQRVQPRARPHLLWKWRCYNEVGGRRDGALLLVRPTEPFCIFSPRRQSSPTFALFTRRIPPSPSAVFHSSLSLTLRRLYRLPTSRPLPSVNARFLLFARASSKLLSEWLRRVVVARLTHVRSPPPPPLSQPSCPSSFGNLDGYRPLLIFTIRGAIFPSFHRALIKWALLIVPGTKDRILEVYLFLSSDVSAQRSIALRDFVRYWTYTTFAKSTADIKAECRIRYNKCRWVVDTILCILIPNIPMADNRIFKTDNK